MRILPTIGRLAMGLGIGLGLLLGTAHLKSDARPPSYAELDLITNVIHLVQEHYVEPVEERKLVEGAIRGMLSTLDPHTTYLPKELFEEVKRDTRGEFEGLGIEITKDAEGDQTIIVVAPIDGTPAARAGIRARDRIVAVCPDATEQSCKSTQQLDLVEAVKLMRGPRGTKIMIQVRREGWDAPQAFVIKRDSIKVSSVNLHLIEEGLPYVRLSQFQERTTQDLLEQLAHAKEKGGPFRGLVLDLRDNPGGLLDQAVKVADVFLTKGLIVASEGRDGGNRMEWHAQEEGTEPIYPMVVLVNGGSASASEIVAGALQDHHRALVLGTETFGKGSVQTIIPLDDDAGLRLTTALYYLPSGRSIQKVRIQPDVAVEPYTDEERTAAQHGAEAQHNPSFGEEHLQGTLKAPEDKSKPKAETREERFAEQQLVDRPLQRAVDLLKSWTIFSTLEVGQGA